MKKLFILFSLLLFFSTNVFCQNNSIKSADTIGHIVKELIEVYDTTNAKVNLKIPDKGYYILVYRYRWKDIGKGIDNKDSIKLLEDKISTILLGGMIGNLKVICLAYDRSADYDKWMQNIKKEKPFKPTSKYKVDYYNLNGNQISEKRSRELFTKLSLFGPDGKIIKFSSSIAKFYYHLKDEKINVKGKLVTVNDKGINEPLNDVLVYFHGENKVDTLGKGITDIYGDFDVNIPNNESSYTLKADATHKNIKNIMLLTQEGKQISYLQKSFLSYEYKLIKADILEMSEMKVEDDISLTFKNFEGSKENKLLVIEDIIYGLDEFNLDKQSAEILNKVVKILKERDKIKLEIISHTDSQGDDASNLSLSKKRANAVAEYLINNGISKKRITAIGKGETEIRNRCFNSVACSDKEHGYNRRTEFKFSK
ncbi:MAG: OmpA family protein [Bacteroidota bacterium]|nr:OmpA family protein [Bacteroidota bacterium]MDP3146202.1 OmpA family protein [Bacteroidota bacterium]